MIIKEIMQAEMTQPGSGWKAARGIIESYIEYFF